MKQVHFTRLFILFLVCTLPVLQAQNFSQIEEPSLTKHALTSLIKKKEIDIRKSEIKWTGYKLTGQHEGLLKFYQGHLIIKNGKLTGGEFWVDMSSLSVTDIEGEYADKLKRHLKSPDFFDVDIHPFASFKISKASPSKVAGDYQIVGDMTIKGITKQIEFDASLLGKGTDMKFTADLSINRADFNVQYASDSFFENLGDKAIYDDFDLSITLALK